MLASAHSGTTYTVSQAASLLGIHANTLRAYCNEGLISCTVLPSGFRRFTQKDLDAFNGVSEDVAEEKDSGRGIFCYARTSSLSQKDALNSQVERLLSEVSARENIPREEITLLKDCASSFGMLPNAFKLIECIQSGKVKRVYLERFNRLGRQVAFTKFVEYVAQKHGTEIIALDRESENPDEQQINMLELVDFVTCLGNKANGKIGAKLLKKHVSQPCLERMVELRRKGHGYRYITDQLVKEGFYGETSMGKKSALSYEKVRSLLVNGSGHVLGVVADGQPLDSVEKSVRDFVTAHVVKGEPSSRLQVKDFYGDYCEYAKGLGIVPRGYTWVGIILKSMIGKADLRYNGCACWSGYRLN